MCKIKLVFLLILSVIFGNLLHAQKIDKDEFLKKLNSAKGYDKIYVYESLLNDDKFPLYPSLSAEFTILKQKALAEKNFRIVNKIELFDAQYNNSVYKYEKAIETLNSILRQPDGLEQSDSIRLFYLLKKSYLKTKNILKALEVQKQLEVIKKKDNSVPFWILMPTLSQMYLDLGLYDQAISQLKQEYAAYPMDFSDDNQWANYYNNLGVYYNRASQPDSAIAYFIYAKKRVQNLLKSDPKDISNNFFDGLIDGNIGQAIKYKKEYAAAIPLLKKDIYWSLLKNNLPNAATSLNELGECYFMINNYALAEEKLDSAYIFLENTDDLTHILQNIKLKAQLATLNKNYKRANDLFNTYIKLNDSLNLAERSIQAVFQKDSYESIENIKKINQQQNKILEDQIEFKNQSEYKNIFFVGFLAALSFMFYFFLINKKRKGEKIILEQKNNDIENHKLQLEKSLKEKEILFKEIHHRVKNNMQVVSSLLSLQIEKVENKTAKSILQDGRSRVDSIALIHKYLYENVDINKIKIDQYLATLVEQIKFVLQNKDNINIKIDLDIEAVNFDLDTTIPIGLIINELVSNSYKYAFPNNEGTIKIKIKKQHLNKFDLLISDNGIGLPPDYRTKRNESLGLELVEMLAEQIEASIDIDNIDGAHFKFSFFYPRYKKPD